MDPLAFIHYLRTLGELVHVETIADTLPELAAGDPENCYLGFEIALRSTAPRAEIEAGRLQIAEQNDQLRRLYGELAAEKHKSDALLQNILPVEVAEELKRTGQVKPVHYDSVTVLFTDFKGFTRTASRLSPERLLRELESLCERQLGRPIDGPPAGTDVTLPILRGRWDEAALADRLTRSPLLAKYKKERAYWESAVARAEKDSFQPLNLTLIGGRGDPGDLRLGGGVALTFPITKRNLGEIARAERAASRVTHEENAALVTVRARLSAAYEQIVGEAWKPFERPLETPGASLDRKAAQVQMAAFG